MIAYDLTVPPSANKLTVNRRSGGRHKSEQYESWIEEAGWMLRAQRARPIAGKVRIGLELSKASGLDLDNCLKPTLDLLVKNRVIEDDQQKYVVGITLDWSSEIEGLRVTIRSVEDAV